jgi:hypothetical protein
MNTQYLPPLTHVTPLATIRRQRELPIAGTVTVRVGQKVQAMDVIAEAEGAPRHVFIDVVRGLGVGERQAGKYITCKRGDRVDAGGVLAGPVGLARRTLRAPAVGRVVSISGGRILFEMHSGVMELRAGMPGVVVGTDGVQSVTLETTGALLNGMWGNGGQDYGVMRLVGDGPDDYLQTDRLNIDLRGAVLIAGICNDPGPLKQVSDLAVRGLILASLSSDMIPAVMRLSFPVIVMVGFGSLPFDQALYQLLSSNAGREAMIDARTGGPFDAQRPEVIVPLPTSHEADLPAELAPMKVGARVRTLREPHMGVSGVVRDLQPQAVDFPSGILARSARVDLDGIGPTLIPLDNLELLR